MAETLFLEISIAGGLLTLMLVATEAGFRCGRRIKSAEERADSALGTVQGATLGLLALLLGFSYAAAGSRFIDRQDMIVTEANAIGTAYLRADLLDKEHREPYREALRKYADARIEFFGEMNAERLAEVQKRCEALHLEMWRAAVDGVKKSAHFDETVLPPLNEVIDLHTKRLTLMNRHIPALVLGVLIVCSAVALGTVGYGCGSTGRRHLVLTFGLAFLLTAALWLVIDLDYPRRGFIRINQDAMLAVKQNMQAQ